MSSGRTGEWPFSAPTATSGLPDTTLDGSQLLATATADKIGIGVVSGTPLSKLEVRSTDDQQIAVVDSGSGAIAGALAGIGFYATNTAGTVKQLGSVGIEVTSVAVGSEAAAATIWASAGGSVSRVLKATAAIATWTTTHRGVIGSASDPSYGYVGVGGQYGMYFSGSNTISFTRASVRIVDFDSGKITVDTSSGRVVLFTDTGLQRNGTSGELELVNPVGIRVLTKFGLNITPAAVQNTTGTATGFTAGAGTAVTHLSTFTGNSGSTAYTVGDLVRAFKTFGFLAA